jgi:eukaryotic-like serine/threonine-protein kinase
MSGMTDEQWRATWKIYQEISNHSSAHQESEAQEPGKQRPPRELLDNKDPAVEQAVERLLAQEEAAGGSPFDALADEFMKPQPPLREGDQVAHYRILSMLGQGGMGVVYRAEDTKLRRTVALKFLAPHILGYGDEKERFLREARAIAALQHPNICTIHEINEASGHTFIAMGFVEGESLAEALKTRRLPLREAIRLAAEIAAGLQAAHAKGIIHRDIKPGNIMLTSPAEPHATILDFGLALVSDSSRTARQTSPAGTIRYMSPEQAAGEVVDARTDIWSLAAVLYEMTTGRKAFPGDSDRVVLNAICHTPPLPPRAVQGELPLQLEWILSKGLAKQRDGRYRTAEEFQRDLKLLLEYVDSKQTPTFSPVNKPKTAGKMPAVLIWLAAGMAAVASAGLGVWWARSRVPAAKPSYRVTQATFDTGLTFQPALSPDGKLLAYSSDRAGNGDQDIWVQQLDSWSQPRRLTFDKGNETTPVFSPDGATIAYCSTNQGGGIYLIPSFGGHAQLIAPHGTSPSFSPDGSEIVYALGHSQLWVKTLNGGVPRRLAASFRTAENPLWFPSGRRILFVGLAENGLDATAWDWWVQSADGGEVTHAGRPNFQGVLADGVLPVGWLDNGRTLVVSTASNTGTPGIWDVPFSLAAGHISGDPSQFSLGVGEAQPAVSASGRLAFAALSQGARVWAVSIRSGHGPPATERPLTPEGGSHLQASISEDGGQLAYTSWVGGGSQVWIRDVVRQEDEPLSVTSSHYEARPQISPDGSRIAFQDLSHELLGRLYVAELASRGVLHQCDACGVNAIPWGWSHDKRRLLFNRNIMTLQVFDFLSKQASDLIKKQQREIWQAFFSPNDRWIVFLSDWQGLAQIWVAPVTEGRAIAENEWIRIADGSEVVDKPRWSVDGKSIYYLSLHDGFYCLWKQTLNGAMKPLGDPVALHHFHQSRLSPASVSKEKNDISVTADSIVLTLGDIRGNIWRMEPNSQPGGRSAGPLP